MAVKPPLPDELVVPEPDKRYTRIRRILLLIAVIIVVLIIAVRACTMYLMPSDDTNTASETQIETEGDIE